MFVQANIVTVGCNIFTADPEFLASPLLTYSDMTKEVQRRRGGRLEAKNEYMKSRGKRDYFINRHNGGQEEKEEGQSHRNGEEEEEKMKDKENEGKRVENKRKKKQDRKRDNGSLDAFLNEKSRDKAALPIV